MCDDTIQKYLSKLNCGIAILCAKMKLFILPYELSLVVLFFLIQEALSVMVNQLNKKERA